METESRMVAAQSLGEGETRVSVWEDEKVLELDGGDGCKIMWMYLMLTNCTLKMVKTINFMYIFYV